MTKLRISEVASLLQVSDDTVRRWADSGRLATTVDEAGRAVVDGVEVARFMAERAPDEPARESPVVERLGAQPARPASSPASFATRSWRRSSCRSGRTASCP